MTMSSAFNALYYRFKPIIPRQIQIWVRRKAVMAKLKRVSSTWPIQEACGQPPEHWTGWPARKRIALVLTHDVESSHGLKHCLRLARMEMALGFRSAFNFVTSRYAVPDSLREKLERMGFEIGVHGAYHDGKLFQSREIFRARTRIINHHLRKWKAEGFRAPAMHHNLEWLHELEISYDMSTFDTDPFEPQADGVGTVFPFWVSRNGLGTRYLEMPYTLAQDFTIFILMREKSTHIWQKKLNWLIEKGGMALLNTHPDYMAFGPRDGNIQTYPADLYIGFLEYLKSSCQGMYWNVLPKEMVRYYENSQT
jgi:hypothetical protein